MRKRAVLSCGRQRGVSWFGLMLGVLAMSAAAAVPDYTVLHQFGVGDVGLTGWGGLAQGRDGQLYGTATSGGANNCGSVFKISTAGVVTTLHDFDANVDGCAPYGGVTSGNDGSWYGTTYGDQSSGGTVFKMTPTGVVTVLHRFALNDYDGDHPMRPPQQGRDGAWYGVTSFGGLPSCYRCSPAYGMGAIYRVTSSGQFSVLHRFGETGYDGAWPKGDLTLAADGTFYGVTQGNSATIGAGSTVFNFSASGSYRIVYHFTAESGALQPTGGLIQTRDGNFYGTTMFGGGAYQSAGAVFKLTPRGVLTVLHTFDNGSHAADGYTPYAALVEATDGNLYGTTEQGGDPLCRCGTVFRITRAGSFSVVHVFKGAPTDGGFSRAALTQHTDGALYGVTAPNIYYASLPPANAVVYRIGLQLAPFVRVLPAAAKVGRTVGLLGGDFASSSGVAFNGVSALVKSSSKSFLSAVVPAGPATGPFAVTTSSGTRAGNTVFRVLPSMSGFSPSFGSAGTVVELLGSGLTQTTSISVGGVKVTSYTVVNDGKIGFVIPSSAVTGKIVLRTAGGSVRSPTDFSVLP